MKLLTVTALFACCLGLSPVAQAGELYVLEISAENPPPRAWSKIEARSLYLLSILVNADPSLSALGPGEPIPYADDDDSYDDFDVGPVSNVTSDSANKPPGRLLRGFTQNGESKSSFPTIFERELQGGSQCPASCADSGRSHCRSIGCAWCGDRCDNRRLQDSKVKSSEPSSTGILSEEQILVIESRIDEDLKRFCKLRPNCTITSDITFVVYNEGSSTVQTEAPTTPNGDATNP